ncbi:IclR family transcriptional regulator [Marinomonas ostreistagni]|uniref:Helix-turn-helix domain-containing protein n=1 Tax=Marinomonas ostreistagni TaxID=359209 RepID=A0ABS0ZEL9_9GAMM|nr:helix-turn-helix domain-containing protein [Marinomonas ostreistagni]MBJ7552140.1 helix-turn-helix domain-containing protein [Marinomonas ostreistagni]
MTLALDRGIQILAELGNAQGLTLSEVSQRTGIPKSTTHRLLKRLTEQHLVRQNLLDQRYRSNVLLPQQTEVHIPPADQPLIEIICQHAEALTDQVLWPSDIFIPIDNKLFLVESTRAITRLHINHCRIQTEVSMLRSAAGRVLLAYCNESDRERYLDTIWTNSPSNTQQQFYETWPSLHKQILQQGFAYRSPSYFGERGVNDGLRAIAVPIMSDSKVRACINLVWPNVFADEKTFANNYAALLKHTAANISNHLKTINRGF